MIIPAHSNAGREDVPPDFASSFANAARDGPIGTTPVRVAEKADDALVPKPAALLHQRGALEALAEAAIRKTQSNPMCAIPDFRAQQD